MSKEYLAKKETVDNHIANKSNPHGVTAAQVGAATSANVTTAVNAHANNKSNPHGVTKAQVGLGNVDNTADSAKPVSMATQTALNAKAAATTVNNHINNKSNPHAVTAAQVGLSDAQLAAKVQSLMNKGSISMIKSVQRGRYNGIGRDKVDNAVYASIKINAVNMNKSFVTVSNPNFGENYEYEIAAMLNDSTTLRLYGGKGSSFEFENVCWEVIEFN